MRAALITDQTPTALQSLAVLPVESVSPEEADVIVCIGGDGFMLHTIQHWRHLHKPFFGLNAGHVGFLMNPVVSDMPLSERILQADTVELHPLKGTVQYGDSMQRVQAINEISFLRSGPQTARVRVSVDDMVRLNELVCDGAMVATPAGSTAYNFSAWGPVLPLGSPLLALTPISAFRPRRWRGALVASTSRVRFDILEPEKRPVSVCADGVAAGPALSLEITQDRDTRFRLLFDRGRNLSDRILNEQFSPE